MLSINISELILTILNFFILYFVLDKLLFKPLITFMDQRQKRIEAGLEKERTAAAAVESCKKRNESREEEQRRRTEQLLQDTRTENARHHAQLLAQLHEAELAARKAMAEDVERLEEKERAELTEKDGELAQLLAQRFIQGRV